MLERKHNVPVVALKCPTMRVVEREVCPLSARADIYFPLYVPPLRRAAQSADHLLKGIGVFGGEGMRALRQSDGLIESIGLIFRPRL